METPRNTVIEAYYRLGGNIHAVARELGRDRKTIREHLQKAGIKKPVAAGDVEYREPRTLPRGSKRFLLSCAQSNTKVHPEFLKNAEAFAEFYDAKLLVSKTFYNTHKYTRLPDKSVWFDPALDEYYTDENLELAPGLAWFPSVMISPTATNPLSGFDSFAGERSAVFAHPQIAMKSVPTGAYEPTRFNYTTGCLTQRNYIKQKAGEKASFHHSYGFLLVETDSKGRWWARQVTADADGTFYDLDTFTEDGTVWESDHVAAAVWGDIHEDQLNSDIRKLVWEEGGVLDQLRPQYQVMHDLFDHRARNHHDTGKGIHNFRKFLAGNDDVEEEIRNCGDFLDYTYRDDVVTVVVDSNHDRALNRWLEEGDHRKDPKNAVFFLEASLRLWKAARDAEKFHLLEWALTDYLGREGDRERFLRIDEPFTVSGVDLGQHGDLGANGSRGNPTQFARIGRKSITGHTHTAGIQQGVFVVGTFSTLNPDYTKGPSAWSNTFAVEYPNGKRTLITIKDKKFRA